MSGEFGDHDVDGHGGPRNAAPRTGGGVYRDMHQQPPVAGR